MPASAQHDRILRHPSAALPSHDERLDALLHLAPSASGARVAFVSTVVGDRERIRAQVGTLGGLRAGASAPLSDGLLGHVLAMQAPVAVPHTRHHLLTKESRWIGPSVAGSVLSVPDNPLVTPREVVTIPLSDDAAPQRVLVLARQRDRAPFEPVELDAATYAADAVAIVFIRLDARPCISTAS